MRYILAIDQGTTSSRAILFDEDIKPVAIAQREFRQIFPKPGWVEHDPEEIWQSVLTTLHEVMAKAGVTARQIQGIGITNQRETTVLWDRKTGKAIHNALVWQDRRTEPYCQELRESGFAEKIREKTGLLADPYFSGTKIRWLLETVDGARRAAENGDLAFGTIDSFLVFRLTGGKSHRADITNASRTLLFDIHRLQWDEEILAHFDVPSALLPQVLECADDFGTLSTDILGTAIPITGVAGDQQAATIGQACFEPGMMKSTYGTGCFALLNTGAQAVLSRNRLLTTIAYQIDGQVHYALEGSIFMAGAAVQWLRDGLKIIEQADETGDRAANSDPDDGVYLVPAFVGLGAPYWDADARGALFGLTRGTGQDEIIRATLEAVCYQTHDLIAAMQADWQTSGDLVLRVDGGLVASDWTMQFLSNILNVRIDRPTVLETTALGAAWLAGYKAGLYPGQKEFAKNWVLERSFTPDMDNTARMRKLTGWKDAVQRTLSR